VFVFLAGLWTGCTASPPDRYTILFAGDTSYGENYQTEYARGGSVNILEARGYDYSLEKLKPLLLSSDLVVANLETPVTDIERSPLTGKGYIHWSDVTKTPAGLRRHNIRVVSLANNHAMDFGVPGLDQTLRVLSGAGIESFGAGMNETAASEPWRRDIRVGDAVLPLRVIGALAYNWPLDRHYSFYARGDTPGIHVLLLKERSVAEQVRLIKEAEPTAFVVVFPHWGQNYKWKDKAQERMAHRLVDAGADLILGHGAHMMQELELYKGRWIAYSLGNFMFNSGGRYAKLGVRPYSLPARLLLEREGDQWKKTLRFYPIFSDNNVTRYRPRPVTRREFAEVVSILGEKSGDRTAFSRRTRTDQDQFGYHIEIHLD
jgi:hypothetical protein